MLVNEVLLFFSALCCVAGLDHLRVRAYVNTLKYLHTHSNGRMGMRARTHAYIHAHARARARAHTHTHIHT